jgi:hypothetical protein
MQSHTRRNWKRWLLGALVLLPIASVSARFFMTRSDAFETASAYLRNHPEIVRSAGAVRETSLAWRGGSLRVSGDSGSANFSVNVEGEVASPRAYVELKKRGIWEVTFVRLIPEQGEPIVLKDGR